MNEQLRQILMYCTENDFYKKRFRENGVSFDNVMEQFEQIPILKKGDIRNCYKQIESQNYLDRRSLERISTSGTTGEMVNVFWDKFDLMSSNFSLWKKRGVNGINPASRLCTFHTYLNRTYSYYKIVDYYSPREIIYNRGNTISLSKLNLSQARLYEYIGRMNDFQPEWIFTQPSFFIYLDSFFRKENQEMPKSVRYIELTGEYISMDLMMYFRKRYPEIVFVNHYGAKEVNCIAYECEFGNLHCLESNVYVEIVDESGHNCEEGNVCVTSLHNRVMPLIRYKLDDRGRIYYKDRCPCGDASPVLSLLHSRRINNCNDISPYLLQFAIERINALEIAQVIHYFVKEINRENKNIKNFFILFSRELSDSEKRIVIEEFKSTMVEAGENNHEWEVVFEIDLGEKNKVVEM